jgi:hypothetical protein
LSIATQRPRARSRLRAKCTTACRPRPSGAHTEPLDPNTQSPAPPTPGSGSTAQAPACTRPTSYRSASNSLSSSVQPKPRPRPAIRRPASLPATSMFASHHCKAKCPGQYWAIVRGGGASLPPRNGRAHLDRFGRRRPSRATARAGRGPIEPQAAHASGGVPQQGRPGHPLASRICIPTSRTASPTRWP